MKHSAFLEFLITRAKNIGEKDSPLTYERFMAATIDFLYNSKEQDSQFAEEATETAKLLQSYKDVSWHAVQTKLMDYSTSTEATFADVIAIQRIMLALSSTPDGKEVLTVQNVVKELLEKPSDAMQKIMNESSNGAETDLELGNNFAVAETVKESLSMDYISELTAKVIDIQKQLLAFVHGQDNAVSTFASGYFKSQVTAVTTPDKRKPAATFLFAGPPGVGKTLLSESIGKVLGLPFARFDLSEYADKEANLEFCGYDKVYKSSKAGNVTSFVSKNPRCVLLFDEVEKAHPVVINLFLQMLDAGRLHDNYYDTEVSFKDAIIIFTTNAGKQLYSESNFADYSALPAKVILKALEKDINPQTNAPFFPAALCSRFASGNVVMFNHMLAHNLRKIAKSEMLKSAEQFGSSYGVTVEIDEKVYTSMLLSVGGNADARTVSSKASSFFMGELYEAFRLLSQPEYDDKLKGLKKITLGVDMPKDNNEVSQLFVSNTAPEILVFASPEIAGRLKENSGESYCILESGNAEEAKRLLKERDVSVVLADPLMGLENSENACLNTEDMLSESRKFLKWLEENDTGVPVYIIDTDSTTLTREEKQSYLRSGIRGFVDMTSTCTEAVESQIMSICSEIHQQESMIALASANKVLEFETSQALSEDDTCINIKIFDMHLTLAVEAEDSENILSNMSKPDVKFDDVIGAESAKKELEYFVDYMKNPKKHIDTGVSSPRGLLFYGPPGTGKTMLAKAMACEAGVAFIATEGNKFIKKFVGEGEQMVHEIFRTARKYAPAILFVDEIDAIAKERTGGGTGYSSSTESILTAFLSEMDGFRDNSSKPVFVLAATNFTPLPGSPKSLDIALVRRFDRSIFIDLPDKNDRIKFLKMRMKKYKNFNLTDEDIDNIAVRSTSMSLANLESVMELAVRNAIMTGCDSITEEIMDEAFETYNSGETREWNQSELERTARHEAGHALICWLSGETPTYVTVVSRGNHGGYMQHVGDEGKGTYTKNELLARIRTSLGGRAAEIVYYGEDDGLSTGASSDLYHATGLTQDLICSYGMDEKFGLGVISPESYLQGELSEEVRSAVNDILAHEMNEAIRYLHENRDALDAMVELLMVKNSLKQSEIEAVFANVPRD